MTEKRIDWEGDSYRALCAFPEKARRDSGFQLGPEIAYAMWNAGGKTMSTKHVTPAGGNIFADLKLPDAENLKLRLDLMVAVQEWVESSGLTQAEAAKRMETSQPLLNDALKGRYQRFTIDRLVRMLEAVGKRVSVSVSEAA